LGNRTRHRTERQHVDRDSICSLANLEITRGGVTKLVVRYLS
jgi:hypothetical protein